MNKIIPHSLFIFNNVCSVYAVCNYSTLQYYLRLFLNKFDNV